MQWVAGGLLLMPKDTAVAAPDDMATSPIAGQPVAFPNGHSLNDEKRPLNLEGAIEGEVGTADAFLKTTYSDLSQTWSSDVPGTPMSRLLAFSAGARMQRGVRATPARVYSSRQ